MYSVTMARMDQRYATNITRLARQLASDKIKLSTLINRAKDAGLLVEELDSFTDTPNDQPKLHYRLTRSHCVPVNC